jgi:DNA primase
LQLAYDLGYAFVTEGITDTIRMRDMGYKNCFAMCGTHSSEYIIRQLNRCRHGVILIPDRDDAGLRALKGWKFNRSVTIFINLQYKDIDEMCSIKNEDGTKTKNEDNIEIFKEYADACVEWLKTETHDGKACSCEQVTVL